jgi:hypothetical protein
VIGAIFGGVITSAPRRNMAVLRRLSEGGSQSIDGKLGATLSPYFLDLRID